MITTVMTVNPEELTKKGYRDITEENCETAKWSKEYKVFSNDHYVIVTKNGFVLNIYSLGSRQYVKNTGTW